LLALEFDFIGLAIILFELCGDIVFAEENDVSTIKIFWRIVTEELSRISTQIKDILESDPLSDSG